MPGRLMLFGCALPFASDDLFVPALGGIAVRCILGPIVLALVVVEAVHPSTCAYGAISGASLLAWILAALVVNFLQWIALLIWSLRGGIMEGHKRDFAVSIQSHLLLVGYLFQFAATVYGSATTQGPCPLGTSRSGWVNVALVLSWIDLISALLFGLFIIFFASLFTSKNIRNSVFYERNMYGIFTVIGLLTCGICGVPTQSRDGDRGEQSSVWLQIAQMAALFLGDMGETLVLSDLIAAMVLLRIQQRERDNEALATMHADGFNTEANLAAGTTVRRKVLAISSALPLSHKSSWISRQLALQGRVVPADEHLRTRVALDEADSFAPYAVGIYGWVYYLFCLHPITGLWRLLTAPSLRPGEERDQGMGFAGRAFKQVTGIRDEDVLFASWTSHLGEAVPWAVCLDHKRKAVVVAIRGSISLNDVVTDLHCEPMELETCGRFWGFDGKDHYAHSGMLKVALKLRLDLEDVLSKLFPAPRRPVAQSVGADSLPGSKAGLPFTRVVEPLPPGYRLVIVGHSLGAGVASIASVLLRPSFPEVKAIAYSPPGFVFDRALADASSEWITSVWVGKDAVPRLSWKSVKQLRGSSLELLRRCKVDKWTAIASYRAESSKDLLHAVGEIPPTPAAEDLKQRIQVLNASRNSQLLDTVDMYAPGKLLYLCKTFSETCRVWHFGFLPGRNKVSHYAPFVVRDRSEFQEILVSGRMLMDHLPDFAAGVIHKANAFEHANHQGFAGAINPGFEGGGEGSRGKERAVKGFVLGLSTPKSVPEDVEV